MRRTVALADGDFRRPQPRRCCSPPAPRRSMQDSTIRFPSTRANPVILYQDDWSGDWLGEYAVLLAKNGGPPLAGIIINASKTWGDLDINTSGWNDLVNAARASGLTVPDVTSSEGGALTMPANGQIDSTTANNSLGAQRIRDLSTQVQPARPPGGRGIRHLADGCGGRLPHRSLGRRSGGRRRGAGRLHTRRTRR